MIGVQHEDAFKVKFLDLAKSDPAVPLCGGCQEELVARREMYDRATVETMEEYHAKRGKFLSSHLLGDFRKCPELYQKKVTGQIPDVDRPAYRVGRAAHTLILEGEDVFRKSYAFGGPINEKTGRPYGATTKKYMEWAAEQGRPVLPDDQLALAQRLAESVRGHAGARTLLSEGRPEAVFRSNVEGVDCQARIDWLNADRGIVDLKTCKDLTWFEHDARSYGYTHQMEFYRQVFREATGSRWDTDVHIIAVEKVEPFRCGVWKLTVEALGAAAADNGQAIRRLVACRKTDTWPTGYEETRKFDRI